MFKRILVPVDGSPVSGLGLKTAIRMARSGKAALMLLHVVDENVMAMSSDGDYAGAAQIDQLLKDLRANGSRIVARAAAAAKKQGVAAKTVLVEKMAPGRVADVIVAQARKLRADVIVLGTHGRDGIQRIVMGSDAEEVTRNASVPVLLVRTRQRS
jgi:nucleotide-binding universal stress UspA family protein